jgi:hypothetical protein
VFRTTSVPLEELLFAFDEDDDFAEEEDFAEELLSASDDEDAIMLEELTSSPRELEEFEAISELLAGACDELDSTSELLDSTGVELDDSALELLDCELLEIPYLE